MLRATARDLVGPAGAGEPARTGGRPALVFAFKDSQLKWGACPDFIPKGCEIAVLHGDPAKANADIFFKVPANFTIPITGTHRPNAWCWFQGSCT